MEEMKHVIEQVCIDSMMASVKTIAGWERMAGSEGEQEAFSYLRQSLEAMGYETELMQHDAWISIPIHSEFTVNGEIITSRTHSMGTSTNRGGVTGELIYCGDLNEIKKIKEIEEKREKEDFRGKIIVTNGRAVFSPVEKAGLLGAAGIVFIQDLPIRECIPSAAWGSPTPYNKHLLPTIPVISIGEPDGLKLLEKMRQGTTEATLITELDNRWRKIPLLTGELKAPIHTELFAMFTGHVDSWYYGAIDNGTANAVQLETARITALNREKLRRNFRVVFFSGHSQGRYAGSAWYSDHYWEDIHKNCIVNVNADSLGGRNADDITRSIIMPETKELAAEIIKKQTGVDFTGVRCGRVADQSFWNAGVSSAFASFSKQKKIEKADKTYGFEKGNSDLGWWWHTPEDTLENVDPVRLLRDANIFVEYVQRFLTDEVLPLYFTGTVEEILLELNRWSEKAGDRFPMEDTLKKADRLKEACGQFYNNSLPSEAKNRMILKLGRILVPLNYTSGNRYKNDSAQPRPPLPSLLLIDKLQNVDSLSDEAKELCVELIHKKNFVNDSLNRALELLGIE